MVMMMMEKLGTLWPFRRALAFVCSLLCSQFYASFSLLPIILRVLLLSGSPTHLPASSERWNHV